MSESIGTITEPSVASLSAERQLARLAGPYHEMRWCAAKAPEGWECTRPAGHEGSHVADTSRHILGMWAA